MHRHNAYAIRNALYQVFVLPNVSPSTRSAAIIARSIHFGSAAEVMNRSKGAKAFKPPPIHPDIITTDMFQTVSLTPSSGESGSVQRNVPLNVIQHQVKQHNSETTSTWEQKFIIMINEPQYHPTRAPTIELLQLYEAPQKMLTTAGASKDLKVLPPPRLKPGQRRFLPQMPMPTVEPLVKIMTGEEIQHQKNKKTAIEKEAARRENLAKEMEITWTIEENDMQIAFKKMRAWFDAGCRVSIRIIRKSARHEPPQESCIRVIERIREFMQTVPGVGEAEVKSLRKRRQNEEADKTAVTENDLMAAIGHSMQFSYSAPKVANTQQKAADTTVKLPWRMNDGQLKLHIKTVTSALKKGKTIRIEMVEGDEFAKVKAVLPPDEIIQRIRSSCRQLKDVKINNESGTVESQNIVLEVSGGSQKNKARDLEIDTSSSERALETRLEWIKDWLKADKLITIWPSSLPDSTILPYLQKHLDGKATIEVVNDTYTIKKVEQEVDPEVDTQPSQSIPVARQDPFASMGEWNQRQPQRQTTTTPSRSVQRKGDDGVDALLASLLGSGSGSGSGSNTLNRKTNAAWKMELKKPLPKLPSGRQPVGVQHRPEMEHSEPVHRMRSMYG